MKLGFLTQYSKERMEFAGHSGFDCVALSDGGPGAEFDVTSITADQAEEVREVAERNGIVITAVACYTAHVEEAQVQRFRSTIRVAAQLGARVAATLANGAPNVKPEGNFPVVKRVFSEYARLAEDVGVKIGLENSHQMARYPENIAFNPVLGRNGIYGGGWRRYRIPGWGEIDWRRIFCTLVDIGYDYAMVIEHEDPILTGPRYDEGLTRGLKYLRQFV